MCYYYGPKSTVYEELGHAEVVQVQLDPDKAQKEMEKFADVRSHLLSQYISFDLWLHAASSCCCSA